MDAPRRAHLFCLNNESNGNNGSNESNGNNGSNAIALIILIILIMLSHNKSGDILRGDVAVCLFAAVEARMVYSLLGGAAAIVRVDYVLHKCAFGATEAQ